jgi:hypothetical protein
MIISGTIYSFPAENNAFFSYQEYNLLEGEIIFTAQAETRQNFE